MKKILALLALSGLVFVSCSDDDDATTPPVEPPIVDFTSGTADFSTYVSVGNSLTAGFSDAALFADGQTASLPNMLASNFALVGGGTFNIPFMADNLGGATFMGQPTLENRLILSFASGSPAPVRIEGTGTTEITNVLSGPFNNMGVPGAKSYQLLAPGFGNLAGVPVQQANPYFARFASSPTASVIGDAVAQNPTFFSLWIGNNDILGYATDGGSGVDHNETMNTDPATYGGSDITNNTVFAGVYQTLLEALTAGGAGGVVANIPDVTSIPFFTTVPYNAIPLDAATATALNSNPLFLQYNGGLLVAQGMDLIDADEVAQRTITFQEGQNAMLMIDEDVTDLSGLGLPNFRQTAPDDLIVFTAQLVIGTLANPDDPTSINGVAVPLADQWVLTPEEQLVVSNAVASYNQTIGDLATQFDLAFVDANALLDVVAQTGVSLSDGSTITSTFGTGGGFSLDGVHPSPRGYALLANLFVEAINAKYGSNLPGVEPLDFTGLYIN
ncbi:MAG: G-D-S-L family lipolytic protein [Saonia sp.]